MTWPVIGIWLFLSLGLLNVGIAGWQDRLILNRWKPWNKDQRDHRDLVEGLLEALFYFLLWWVQLLFWLLFQIGRVIDWIGFHVWGAGSSKKKHHPKHRG